MDSDGSHEPLAQPVLSESRFLEETSNVIEFRVAGGAGGAVGAAAVPVPVERRRDYDERVRYQCRMAGVPLRRCENGDIYFLIVKPILDVTFASIMLVLLSPLFLIVALLIKMQDGGPVFFVQNRTGYLGRRFPLLKFRTMIPGAEAAKSKLTHLNLHQDGSPDFKVANDPRITPVGRWLRAWSLDELPNLVNVVRCELSLVGPRPTSFDVSTYASHHLTRLAVRPGITGLWQVSGRALVGFDRRCELDEEYIRTASLRGDLKLLAQTAGAVLKRHGAL
jgi:lipopolysaccharide/colanic/teichoic acid biosynthesis glycosyltransferase